MSEDEKLNWIQTAKDRSTEQSETMQKIKFCSENSKNVKMYNTAPIVLFPE